MARSNVDHKDIIAKRWTYLVENLDPLDVQDELITEGVMSIDEVEQFNAKETRKGKVRKLLGIINHKSSDKFKRFLHALKPHQTHVYNVLCDGKVAGSDIEIANVTGPWKSYQDRDEEQNKISKAFETRQTVWLSGMAGSGKTQLCWWHAKAFIKNHKDKRRGYIVWKINGSNEENITSGLQSIASKLGGGEQSMDCLMENQIESKFEPSFEQFLDNLKIATRDIPTLLIVDSYKADGASMLQKIESILRCWEILVNTSEKQQVSDTIVVKGFTEKEAFDYSKTLLQESQEYDDKELFELFQSLDYSPLGLTSVLLYMNTMKMTIERYRKLLANQPTVVQEDEEKLVTQTTGYKGTLFKAIRLVLNSIQKQFEEEFEAFKYMSLFAMDHMLPVKVFTSLLPKQQQEIRFLQMSRLLKALDDVHFLTETTRLNEKRTVAFHRSVQENLEDLVKDEKEDLVSKLVLHIISYVPKEAVIDEWYEGNRILKPHILSLLNHADQVTNRSKKDALARIKLYDILGYIESKTGLKNEARKHLLKAKMVFYNLIGYKESDLPINQLIEERESTNIDFESENIKRKLQEEANCLIQNIKRELSGALQLEDILAIRKEHIRHAYRKGKKFDSAIPEEEEEITVNDMYNELVKEKRFFSENLLVEIYPQESFAVVLYSAVYYKPENDKEKLYQQHDLHLCKTLCELIRERNNLSGNQAILHEMLSQRDGLLQLDILQNSWSSLQKSKKTYTKFLENGKEYFYLGLSFRYSFRGSGGSHDLYYQSVCLKELLKCLKSLHNLAADMTKKKAIIAEADNLITHHVSIIEDLKKESILQYACTELQIAFGEFYNSIGESEKSVEFYNKVFEKERNRDFQRLCAAMWLFMHYKNNADKQREGCTAPQLEKYKTFVKTICAKKSWYRVEVEKKAPLMLNEFSS